MGKYILPLNPLRNSNKTLAWLVGLIARQITFKALAWNESYNLLKVRWGIFTMDWVPKVSEKSFGS